MDADAIRELVDTVEPRDPAAAIQCAATIIAQTGDLPEGIWFELGSLQADRPAMWRQLKAMRPVGAPPYTRKYA